MNLKGTGVALVTPFDNSGNIDFNSLKKLVHHVINGSVDYLVVMGTTAENPVLSSTEKEQILATVVQENQKRVPIVYGVGGYNTHSVIEEINKYNHKTEIDAFLCVTPYYNKPNQEGLYQHFSKLALASQKPIILYNVPGRTGVNMTAETTLKLAHQFSNIIAIKEASGSFEQIMEIVSRKPLHFYVISGDDGITLPLISIGVDGVISVVANAIPSLFSTMVNLALSGNFKEAQNIHYKILPLCKLAFTEGNPTGIKAALSHLGIIQNYLRLPLVPASFELSEKIKNWINQNL